MYSGLATYHPALKFRKDDKPVQDYAYPCTAVGTVVLVFGMLLCSYVVESSTDEKRYQATDDWKTRIVWLQQTKTVSDQVFESCMVYAKDDRQIITTSRRMKPRKDANSTDKNEDVHSVGYDDPSASLQLVTISGTAVALCGFVLQFVGLRGMHWSASVAQLGAVIVMVAVKAWVRRGLARSPAFKPLPSGFELDSFVKSLGFLHQEPWSGSQSSEGGLSTREQEGKTPQSHKDWTVITGGESSLISPYETPRCTPSTREEVEFNAQTVLNTRKQLASLANWRGNTSPEAISLARAIECTMDNLNQCFPEELVWNLETRYTGSQAQTISIKLSREVGGWKVDATELEAILSLWLSSVNDERPSHREFVSLISTDRTASSELTKGDGDWLRSKGIKAKPSLWLFGEHTPSLHRDLQWWIPRDMLNVSRIRADQLGFLCLVLDVEKQRVVGAPPHMEHMFDPGLAPMIQYLDVRNNGFDNIDTDSQETNGGGDVNDDKNSTLR